MAKNQQDEGLSGIQKAAVLLIALGPEKSATIFKHLKEEEIEELTLEIANTRSIIPSVKEQVIDEFYQVCLAQQYIAEGGIGYAKELLEKALGSEQAERQTRVSCSTLYRTSIRRLSLLYCHTLRLHRQVLSYLHYRQTGSLMLQNVWL